MPGSAVGRTRLLERLERDGTFGRYEHIVVDTAPTGHLLRMFGMPTVLEGLALVDGDPASLSRYETMDRSYPFRVLGPDPRVAIIGSAGGNEILASLRLGAAKIKLMSPPDAKVLRSGPDGREVGFHGIARRIEQVSEALLKLNEGTVYASLMRLQQEGRISASWGSVKTAFRH